MWKIPYINTRNKWEKIGYEREKLTGSSIKNAQIEQNLVSLGIPSRDICIHKGARFNFNFSGKPMNGNMFGN